MSTINTTRTYKSRYPFVAQRDASYRPVLLIQLGALSDSSTSEEGQHSIQSFNPLQTLLLYSHLYLLQEKHDA